MKYEGTVETRVGTLAGELVAQLAATDRPT
jgi:hypothetical protein